MAKLWIFLFLSGCSGTALISNMALKTPADAAAWHALSSFKDTGIFLDTVIRLERDKSRGIVVSDTFWRVKAINKTFFK